MSYSHKPTYPEDEETRETDREIFFNHIKIARATRIQRGPGKGLWIWVLVWDPDLSTSSGKSPTLKDALALIKSRYQSSGETS